MRSDIRERYDDRVSSRIAEGFYDFELEHNMKPSQIVIHPEVWKALRAEWDLPFTVNPVHGQPVFMNVPVVIDRRGYRLVDLASTTDEWF